MAYRQAIRNLERLLTWEGRIPRKKRGQFRNYLEHENERVRAYASQIEAADALNRAEQQLCQTVELSGDLAAEEDLFSLKMNASPDRNPEDDGEMPF